MEQLSETIKNYVNSLEQDMLSEDQQAVLLVGKSDQVYGGSNKECSNKGDSCDGSINKRICTNLNASGCEASHNGKTCTSESTTEDE